MAKTIREKSGKYPGVYWRTHLETGEKTFYIRYRPGGRDTKLIDEPVGKSTRGMTEAKANQLRALRMAGKSKPNTVKRAEIRAAKKAVADKWTICKLWTAYCAARTLSVGRAQADHGRFEKYLARPFGDKEPQEIDSLSVHRLAKRLKDLGLSPATVRDVLELLRRIVNFGFKSGKTAPLGFKIEMPKVDNEKTEFMNPDQLAAYLEALDEEVDQDGAAFFRFMLLTGIRKGALLALKWDDVDFDQGFISLRGETAKSGKTRSIPLSPGAATVLESIARKDSPYIWPGPKGGIRTGFRRMAERLRDKAGLPKDFRPCHGLRHHFASSLASSGKVDLYTLQNLLTHSSVTMTARYAHLSDEALKQAASVADSILDVDQNPKVVKIKGA